MTGTGTAATDLTVTTDENIMTDLLVAMMIVAVKKTGILPAAMIMIVGSVTVGATAMEAAVTTTDLRVTAMMTDGGTMGGPASMTIETVIAVVADEAVRAAKNMARLSAAHLHPKVLSLSQNVFDERLAGMSALQDMKDIPLCKPSTQVGLLHAVAGMALIYYLLGMFNLPGANRTQIVPNILGVTGALPPIHYGQGSFAPGPGVPNLARQSRRLYVGSITYEANETNLQEFFNRKMAEMKIGTGQAGDPVIGVQINHEKSYAFVEVWLSSFMHSRAV